ncbi:MAG: hypothetical protein AAB448_03745, partial [Patescibacteria group bacterium]
GQVAGMRVSMQATDSVIHVDDATTRMYLVVLEGQDPPRAGGYLFPDTSGNTHFYPVEVETDAEAGVHWLRTYWAIDGEPVPDKTGCAYYSGSPESCALGYSSLGSHTPTFSGSIGGRCAATPIAVEVSAEEAESLVSSHQAGWP